MRWWRWWQPDLRLPGPITTLDSAPLQARGIRALILDVDDTIVDRWSREIPPDIRGWLAVMRGDYTIWLVSNNTSRRRISSIAAQVDLPYIHRAGKPSRRALRRVLAATQLAPSQVAMIGDRLLTDILAGNRLGLFTIWVEPIRPKPLLFRL
ncbi:MAG: YqeG family HAD IIIA-type phosphatase [Thermostichales cyanobacterium BF4_bins_65]